MSDDTETQAVLVKAMKVKETLSTDGWDVLSGMLDRKIQEMNSIDNLMEALRAQNITDVKEVYHQVAIREGVIEMVKEWRADIQRLVSNADQYVSIRDGDTDDVLVRS